MRHHLALGPRNSRRRALAPQGLCQRAAGPSHGRTSFIVRRQPRARRGRPSFSRNSRRSRRSRKGVPRRRRLLLSSSRTCFVATRDLQTATFSILSAACRAETSMSWSRDMRMSAISGHRRLSRRRKVRVSPTTGHPNSRCIRAHHAACRNSARRPRGRRNSTSTTWEAMRGRISSPQITRHPNSRVHGPRRRWREARPSSRECGRMRVRKLLCRIRVSTTNTRRMPRRTPSRSSAKVHSRRDCSCSEMDCFARRFSRSRLRPEPIGMGRMRTRGICSVRRTRRTRMTSPPSRRKQPRCDAPMRVRIRRFATRSHSHSGSAIRTSMTTSRRCTTCCVGCDSAFQASRCQRVWMHSRLTFQRNWA
mmetsp:Transcript_2382/g.5937  ORF Transcript_2382/g.5937 Transcript_2382/m.5937 type:complete len:364 (-) Transcript_2382:89-1180(-)